MYSPSQHYLLDEAVEEEEEEEEDGLAPPLSAPPAVLGHKTISFFGALLPAPARLARGVCGNTTCPLTVPTLPAHTGGLALLTNNVTGPGVAALPLVFVSAGWFPALLLLAVLSLTSAAASLLLCDAIRARPGNADLGRRVELLSAVQELLPRWAYWGAFATFLARRAPLSAPAARSR